MSDATPVVEIKGKKNVKVSSLEEWREFLRLLRKEIGAGTIRVRAGNEYSGSDACEDACRGHGGVDLCGETVVACNDGEVFILPSI